MFLKKERDVGKIISNLYKEYYDSNSDKRETLSYYLNKSDRYRYSYTNTLYKANLYTMIKLNKILKSNEFTNSGFTYKECSSIADLCVSIIKWSHSQYYHLSSRDQKEYEIAKNVLSYLYTNMKSDNYSTIKAFRDREKELKEIKIDTSILDNFKNQISGIDKQKSL